MTAPIIPEGAPTSLILVTRFAPPYNICYLSAGFTARMYAVSLSVGGGRGGGGANLQHAEHIPLCVHPHRIVWLQGRSLACCPPTAGAACIKDKMRFELLKVTIT